MMLVPCYQSLYNDKELWLVHHLKEMLPYQKLESEENSDSEEEDSTVPLKDYIPPDYSDEDIETEVINNMQATEQKRKANLEKNRNIESRIRETENIVE